MRIKRIHHLTLAVRDTEQARATFETLFGATAEQADAIPAFGVRTRDIAIGDDTLQLASPLERDSALMRFIERKGEGFYNLALEVDDLDAAVAELAARNVRVSDPVEAPPGTRSAFVTMAATHGLSIQLIQSPEPAALDDRAYDDAGRRSQQASEAPAAAPFVAAPVVAAPEAALPEDAASAGELEASAEAEPSERAPLDLTPDEWSDVD